MQDRDNSDDVSQVRRFDHPGKGKTRARPVPKGRQVDPHAKAAVEALLADSPRDRHLLIEYLHRIQDAHGQISAASRPRADRCSSGRWLNPGRARASGAHLSIAFR
jgi:hypothetical protein